MDVALLYERMTGFCVSSLGYIGFRVYGSGFHYGLRFGVHRASLLAVLYERRTKIQSGNYKSGLEYGI